MQIAKYYFDRFVDEQIKSNKIEENQSFFRILKIVRKNFDKYRESDKDTVMYDLLEKIRENPKETIIKDDFDDILEEGIGGISSCQEQIYQIDIEIFRGIKSKQSILFHDPTDNLYKFNILCGKNGSGKTTICELLEYGLTGTIKEAAKRGYSNLSEYLCDVKGLQIWSAKDVILTGQSFDYDRFLFEKNRIEDFGRLKSQKKEDQKNILSSLFGFEELEDFLTRFNDTTIAQKINTSLKTEKNDLNKKLLEDLGKSKTDTATKIIQYNNGCKELSLTEPKEAEIQSKMEQLDTEKALYQKEKQKIEQGKKLDFSYEGEFEELQKQIENIKTIGVQITKQINPLSDTLIQVFRGIKDGQEEFDDSKCPICETPIDDCVKNPFKNIEAQLLTVKEYLDLKFKQKTNWEELKKYYQEHISPIINNLREISKDNFFDKSIFNDLLSANYDIGIDATLEKYEELCNVYSQYQKQLVDLTIYVKAYNEELNKSKGDTTKIQEIDNNIKKNEANRILVGTLIAWNKQLQEQKKDEVKLQTQLDALKIETNKENEYNESLKGYSSAYLQFTKGLKQYKDNIVEKEQQTIEKLAIKYYNIMNKGDDEDQKLVGIQIEKDGIKIKFKGSTDYDDVLKILSEGHLKCLGLAFLFSRAKKFGAKFLIFDDIINAIDTDHRDGLIDLLLDDDFSDIKFIITTHDRYFDHAISNDKRIAKESISRYSATYSMSEGVRFIPTTTLNFESCLEDAIKNTKIKDGIEVCRNWLEDIIINNNFKYEIKKIAVTQGIVDRPDLAIYIQNLLKDKLDEYKKNTLITDEVIKVEGIRGFFTDDIIKIILNQESHLLNPVLNLEQKKKTIDINIDKVKEMGAKVKELSLALEELISKMKKNNISF